MSKLDDILKETVLMNDIGKERETLSSNYHIHALSSVCKSTTDPITQVVLSLAATFVHFNLFFLLNKLFRNKRIFITLSSNIYICVYVFIYKDKQMVTPPKTAKQEERERRTLILMKNYFLFFPFVPF